jgi:hypothetical protein
MRKGTLCRVLSDPLAVLRVPLAEPSSQLLLHIPRSTPAPPPQEFLQWDIAAPPKEHPTPRVAATQQDLPHLSPTTVPGPEP